MNILFSHPSPQLNPYIERYWGWDTEENSYMPTIPPGVGADFFIHYKSPFTTAQEGQLPTSHLHFSLEHPTEILPSPSIGFIAIRFRTGMLKHFCSAPLAVVADIPVDAEDLWGKPGRQMIERLNGTGDFKSKVALLDRSLTALLKEQQHPAWHQVVNELYYHQDTLKLQDLANQTNLSYRHFRRRFVEETGMPPKHFQHLVRFRRTLKPLLIKKEKHYLSEALDSGYFDQMHFIKDCKRFLNTTPGDFLQEKNFMSHFYYPAL